jgi:hypothetical protein
MWTGQQIFESSLGLMGFIEEDGTISVDDTAIFKARAVHLLNLGQYDLAKSGDLYKTVEYSNKRIPSILGDLNGMTITEYDGINELVYVASGVAYAYYFEADGPGTVYIEDFNGAWNTLATIIVPSSVTSFTAYKGSITPSPGATQSRMRFTGPTYYRTNNRAMFKYPFPAGREPDFQPWIKKTLPSDFKCIKDVILEYPDRQYAKDPMYKLEGRNEFYISYFYEGKIRVIYIPIPEKITSLSQSLEIDDITATALAWFLAWQFKVFMQDETASIFERKYNQLKGESMITAPLGNSEIIDVYGG